MNSKRTIDTICYLFILLFVYAAVAKLLSFERFVLQIGQSPILYPYASYLAVLVPAIELIVSGFLAMNRYRLLGLYASFSLMTMFTLYIIAILQFSEHIPCACGGVLEVLGWKGHLIFNIAFVILSIVGILLTGRGGDEFEINTNPASR